MTSGALHTTPFEQPATLMHFFLFYRESSADGRPICGIRASLALRSVFSTLQRLAPLQSHNSRLAALRQMTLRALRCDGRVPRKSRYSRSGKPPLPDEHSRGRDRGFPEEQLENVSGTQALRFQKAKTGNVFATAGAPVAAPSALIRIKKKNHGEGTGLKSAPFFPILLKRPPLPGTSGSRGAPGGG